MNEVKVFDGNGNLKKIISGKEVSKMFWDNLPSGHGDLPEKKKEKSCKFCEVLFPPSTRSQVFCSKACCVSFDRATRKAPEFNKVCEKCKKPFNGLRNRKFCNNPCKHEPPKTRKERHARKLERTRINPIL